MLMLNHDANEQAAVDSRSTERTGAQKGVARQARKHRFDREGRQKH